MTSTFFRRVIFLLLFIMAIFPALRAQEYKYEIGGTLGGAFYMGDVNKGTLFKATNPAMGAVFRYNANFRWALKADLMWAKIAGSTAGLANAFPFPDVVSFDRSLIDLGGQAEFNFFPYSDKYTYANTRRFTPYLLIGLGLTVAPGGEKTFAGINIPLGIGAKYKVMNRVNLGCELSFRKLFADNLEGVASLDNPYRITKTSSWKNNDWYTCFLLMVTWDFGPRSQPCNNIEAIAGY